MFTQNNFGCITIPDNVKSIGEYAFYRCTSLTSITFSDNITSIEKYTFAYCTSLASVTIPKKVTSIENGAFVCTALTCITIPESVASIGCQAFDGCSSLTSIIFSDTTTWYYTILESEWEEMSGGRSISVTDTSINATYFTSTYRLYYWYKR